jgi:hypothetical protein
MDGEDGAARLGTFEHAGVLGRVQPGRRLRNVRKQGIKRLNREEAQQLQRIYRLGQEVAATRIELHKRGRRVGFSMRRDKQEILNGLLNSETAN